MALDPATDSDGASQTPSADEGISRWLREIMLYEREADPWMKRAKKIVDRFKDKRTSRDLAGAKYNVLWANVQTVLPALYSRNPKPDIQRRFKDEDPVGRVASDVMERCVSYYTDTDEFSATMRNGVMDYLLPGRATCWVRYVPTFKDEPVEPAEGAGEEIGEDAGPQFREVLDYEETCADYVNACDFGHNIARTWDEVWLGWRRVYMTRAALVKRFGKDIGNQVPLDHGKRDERGQFTSDTADKATIYECWDKERACAVWIHKAVRKPLDLRDDPLRLDGFFPFPKPLFANLANDSLIPTPIYTEYQDQAKELDDLTARISSITRSLKVAGIYDASAEGIGRLMSEGVENQLIPVESFALLAEKGGLKNVMTLLPMEEIAATLLNLYKAREQVKNDLYEISGIPDIMRGESEPDETLGAQQIKTSFATNRISDQQRDVQRYARATIRIMVDIICNHFSLDTIKQISGVQLLTQEQKQVYGALLAAPTAPPAMGHNGGPPMMGAPPAPNMAGPQGAPPALPVATGAPAPAMPPGAATPAAPPPPVAPPAPPPQIPLPPGMTLETLKDLMSEPTWEEVHALMRNNALRCFRIDIETDSTIKADELQTQAARADFIKSIGALVQQAENAPPQMWPFLGKTVLWAARSFSVGKDLEGSLNRLIAELEKQADAPQQPRPDPEMAKISAQAQAKQAQTVADFQIEKMKLAAQSQADAAAAQAKIMVQQHLNEIEAARRQAELQSEAQIQKMQGILDAMTQIRKAHIGAAASIEVARINAKADDGAEAEAREASGE